MTMTLSDPAVRSAVLERLNAVGPDSAPRWGRMNAPQMVAHLADALRMAIGELPCRPTRIPLIRRFPVKQLVMYWLPIPKNAPTASELIERPAGPLDQERAAVAGALERFGGMSTGWPEHPLFGRLTGEQWGVVAYRHIDHHLRQFGV